MARVLVVDDEPDTVDTFLALLTAWGHETRKAYDGESVLQQALTFVPDVVLLDLGLPRMDGYEVARRLRKYNVLSDMKIVAVTGKSSEADKHKCMDAGFNQHFAKPVNHEALKLLLDGL